MKRIHLIICCILLLLGVAKHDLYAQLLGEWKAYPSYQNATKNFVAGSCVYGLMYGNLLRYDTEDGSVKLYDSVDDLNDVRISQMAYSKEAKCFVLVYENENIDLLGLDDNVRNISALKDKAIDSKSVNSVMVQGEQAYLSTDFGFLIMDLKQGVILETYRLGVAVDAVTVVDSVAWIGTSKGLYTSSLNSTQIYNQSNWHKRSGAGNWAVLEPSSEGVYAMNKNGVFCFDKVAYKTIKNGTFNYLRFFDDGRICFGNASQVNIVAEDGNLKTYTFGNAWKDVSLGKSGIFWASEGEDGLKPYKLNEEAFVSGNECIQPNSPRRDLFYRMHYDTDGNGGCRLLVAGGINTYQAIFNPATAMMYDGETWSYLDEKKPAEDYPDLWHWNTTDIVQDPSDANHHFASPYRTGLYEYRDGKFVGLYNSDNSPLQSILPDNKSYMNYVSATCLEYDREGNLWMCNQETDTIIRVLTPNRKWHALYYSEIAKETQCDGYLFSSSGVNFLTCRRMNQRGFFGFYTNGTLGNTRDDQHKLRTTIVNQDGTSYTPDQFHCMIEDLSGRIWCGTNLGLFVIDKPSKFFDNDFYFTQVKISRNDGSNNADYLLNGVEINCIAVDGANRKWVGTESDGVYLVSADGTEMLHHFLPDDSPLLSKTIQCIAVNPKTGEVMIGTDRGLCSFMGDATEASDELDSDNVIAYPNPVRPDYTGLIRIEGLVFDSEVKICSTTGQLVWSGVSNGGTCTWNGCNKQGKRVSSGIYHVISNTPDGNKAVVTRIVMIK